VFGITVSLLSLNDNVEEDNNTVASTFIDALSRSLFIEPLYHPLPSSKLSLYTGVVPGLYKPSIKPSV
jgi:hypothetical protein